MLMKQVIDFAWNIKSIMSWYDISWKKKLEKESIGQKKVQILTQTVVLIANLHNMQMRVNAHYNSLSQKFTLYMSMDDNV